MSKYRKKSKAEIIVGVLLMLLGFALCVGGLVYLSKNDVPFVGDLIKDRVFKDVMFDGESLSSDLSGLSFSDSSVHRITLVDGADISNLNVKVVPHSDYEFSYVKGEASFAYLDLEEVNVGLSLLPEGNGYSFTVSTFQSLLGGGVTLPDELPEGDMMDLVVTYKGTECRISFSVPVAPQRLELGVSKVEF